jgi:mRNA-degrading endonuclease toxin of MazEF toxin-antitoxin module
VAIRGEVLVLRRAIGFLPNGKLERFAVIQSDQLSGVLDTVIAVPLDDAIKDYAALPGMVPVSAAEAGSAAEQVALVTQLTCLPLERFEPSRAGRLRPATMSRVSRVAKLVLDLD